MNRGFAQSMLRTALVLAVLIGVLQTTATAQSAHARENRIVGVWDVQVTLLNCSTGATLASFRGLNKYELGGTAQVVPATNPTALSAHVGTWSYVDGNNYKLSFKMFRFDPAGNNIGWQIVRFDIATNEDASAYAGLGHADVFDSNGNIVGSSCPTLIGTRFQ
jgi:hypothetical protein